MLLSRDAATSVSRFAATCSVAEAVGDFVRITATGPVVAKVDIDAAPTQIPDGVIVSKPTATSCLVQTAGTVALAGIVAGGSYFIGTNSKALLGPPANPGVGKRRIHFVGRGANVGSLLLRFAPPTIVLP